MSMDSNGEPEWSLAALKMPDSSSNSHLRLSLDALETASTTSTTLSHSLASRCLPHTQSVNARKDTAHGVVKSILQVELTSGQSASDIVLSSTLVLEKNVDCSRPW